MLWVKGSGGDLGTMKLDGFATLYMDKLRALKGLYRGLEHEDEMVGYLPHATFNLNPRAASIDTPLHAYLPYKHVDHMHPDAVIAIAASKNSQRADREDLWRRDRLAAVAAARLRARPVAREIRAREPGGEGLRARKPRPVHLGATTPRACYETTLDAINRAIAWFESETAGQGGLRRRGGRAAAGGRGGARSPRG